MGIGVKCEVREYPDEDGAYNTLVIRNHWNREDRVHLEIDGKVYTFLKADLINAIDNCTRHK